MLEKFFTISERIKHLRKNILKMSQENFAKKLNVSTSNIGSLEIGRIQPTNRVISDICKAFGVKEAWIRTGFGGDNGIFEETESDLLNHLEARFSLDELDKKILVTYFEIPPDYRETFRIYLKALIDTAKGQHQAITNNKMLEDTLSIYRTARSDDNAAPQILDVAPERIKKLDEAEEAKEI